MIGIAQDGHPRVPRFRPGLFYHLIWPTGYWRLMRFERQGWRTVQRKVAPKMHRPRKERVYYFKRMAEALPEGAKRSECRDVNLLRDTIDKLKIRRVDFDELPLFVGSDATYPAFTDAFRMYGDENAKKLARLRKRLKAHRLKPLRE